MNLFGFLKVVWIPIEAHCKFMTNSQHCGRAKISKHCRRDRDQIVVVYGRIMSSCERIKKGLWLLVLHHEPIALLHCQLWLGSVMSTIDRMKSKAAPFKFPSSPPLLAFAGPSLACHVLRLLPHFSLAVCTSSSIACRLQWHWQPVTPKSTRRLFNPIRRHLCPFANCPRGDVFLRAVARLL